MKNNFYIGLVLSFAVLFMVVYSPLIQTVYLFGTDYYYFGEEMSHFDIIFSTIDEGRLVEGIFKDLFINIYKSLESIKIIRLIGIIGLALLASVIYVHLKKYRVWSDHAFLMSGLICTLPSFQVLVSWSIVSPSIYSAFLSSLSALILFNFIFKENEDRGRKNTLIGYLAPIVLLVTALAINQPPAMMYWTMGVICLLGWDNFDLTAKKNKEFVIKYLSVGFISMMVYYVIFIKIFPIFTEMPVNRGKLMSILNIPDKIKWFLSFPLTNALNLWNINPGYIFALISFAIICAGIILSLLQKTKGTKQISTINYLPKIILIVLLVMLSYLPVLVVAQPAYHNRTMTSLGTAISMLFFFGLINIVDFLKNLNYFSEKSRKTIITILLSILIIAASFMAHNNVDKFAKRHSGEMKYIINTIQDYGVSNLIRTSKIYVRRPGPINRKYYHNEFENALTTHADGAPIRKVIQIALREIGLINEDIRITHGAADKPIPKNKNILIIDMTKYRS